MSEAREKTFGGWYRHLCDCLGDMRDQTNSSLMKKKQKDQQYWDHICRLETRIIMAIMAVEAQDLFKQMRILRDETKFRVHWFDFRQLPEQWADRQYLWKDLDKLKEQRDWEAEHKSVKTAHHAFISANPIDCVREWTENYRAGASPKGANPETREPTFGGAFRKFVVDLEHMIISIDQDNLEKASKINDEWERIRDQEIIIREAIRKLPSDELFKDMVCGLRSSNNKFMECWNCLEQLSSEWEESSSNDSNLATHVGDREWKNDRLALGIIDRNICWAYPWGSKEDDEWKNDYRADPNAIPDPLHLTFKKAWNRMRLDMISLSFDLCADRMAAKGLLGDEEFWKGIQYLEVRIRDNVPKFPHHPLFEHMIIPHTFHSRDRERSDFMLAWEKLEKLSLKWKATSDIWNNKTPGGPANLFIRTRDWKEDAKVLDVLFKSLKDEKPRGFEHDPEWGREYLPVSRMRKDMEFTVDETDLKWIKE